MNGMAQAGTIESVSLQARNKPRLGFIGVGWIGRHRMEAIATSGAACVAAVSDLDHERAQLAGHGVGACIADSYQDLLDSGLDGIVIATPSALHAEQAIAALQRGISVFCQKPLARTADETRRVIEAAQEADRLLGVDLSYRYTTGMRFVKEVVAAGELGEIFAADLVFHNAYGPDKPWFYDVRLSGGGCVMDLGIHLVDLTLWVLGFPEVHDVHSRLYAGGRQISGRESVEDYAVATLDLANGTTANLACSWNLPAGRDAVIAAKFYGTKGGISFHNVDGSFYDFAVERFRGTSRELLCSPPDAWGGRGAVAWAERLSYSNRYSHEAEELLKVSEIMDRIYHP